MSPITTHRRSPGALRTRLAGVGVALLLVAGLTTGCGTTTTSSTGPATTVAATASSAGTCPTSNTTDFAKTKFVLHAGLAFGAFHRYLWKPFRAGRFASGASGRVLTFVKAAAAAVFIEHEVRLAAADVRANPTLCRDIAQPLRRVLAAVGAVVADLRAGRSTSVDQAETAVGAAESTAAGQGASITEAADPRIGGFSL